MAPQTIREQLRRQPFEPFRVVMSSGESCEVRHPEMAMLTRGELLVGVDERGELPTRVRYCSMLHITTIEPLPPSAV